MPSGVARPCACDSRSTLPFQTFRASLYAPSDGPSAPPRICAAKASMSDTRTCRTSLSSVRYGSECMWSPDLNIMKKTRRSNRDEWTYYFGLQDRPLDSTSLALAYASVFALARSKSLIDRPHDLIETPRRR